MIHPSQQQTTASVAGHYDELDRFYREVWGEHVHHGYWETGRETPAEAAVALVWLVGEALDLAPGQQVCDIGCGYGAAARFLAERFDLTVTGVTISAVQAARAAPSSRGSVRVLQRDWLSNSFADECFDRAYAIESSEHMADLQRFFNEAFRTLKPGGRFIVCTWLATDDPRGWEVRHLLEPICREGRLFGMGTEADYRQMAERAGFTVTQVSDISTKVRRTWTICLRRMLWRLLTRPAYPRFLLDSTARNRIFAVTVIRLVIAYWTRSMHYGLIVFRRPDA